MPNPALAALLSALKLGAEIHDDSLHQLIADQPTPLERKQLAMGLRGARLISDDQCALMVHLFSLKDE